MPTQAGPRLTITASCEGCCHLTRRTIRNDSLRWIVQTCAHPDFPRGYWIARIKEKPVPPDDGCPELPAARLALLVDLARTICRKCGRTVEPERECYAIPTCFACLPPPPPLPVHLIGKIDEQQIGAMKVGDRLSEITEAPGEPITVDACEAGWLVRLGIGGVTLAKSARRAMVYVRNRRRLARTADDDNAARGAGESEE